MPSKEPTREINVLYIKPEKKEKVHDLAHSEKQRQNGIKVEGKRQRERDRARAGNQSRPSPTSTESGSSQPKSKKQNPRIQYGQSAFSLEHPDPNIVQAKARQSFFEGNAFMDSRYPTTVHSSSKRYEKGYSEESGRYEHKKERNISGRVHHRTRSTKLKTRGEPTARTSSYAMTTNKSFERQHRRNTLSRDSMKNAGGQERTQDHITSDKSSQDSHPSLDPRKRRSTRNISGNDDR